ncbi:hypothetical protein B1M_33989, partial [Burkholderia sp. TJI49]
MLLVASGSCFAADGDTESGGAREIAGTPDAKPSDAPNAGAPTQL